ncbi:MAG: radical SAM protein [Deltaproteobacteria bacterium]|nr:radical SAM protein [Deltaproteobacteria bacterium]
MFVNSICNLTCDHCFYWQNLNARDDLTFDELAALSRDIGPIENLNLSGGEPFLRPDLDEVVRMFVRENGVRQVYVPTSGFFTDRTEKTLRSILEEDALQLFVVELSIDGMEEYHNTLRGHREAFERAMRTHDMLTRLQREDPRVRVHAISTVTNQNLDDIQRLTDFLFERCPTMEHHNIPVIRGDRKDPSLLSPDPDAYRALWEHVQRRWAPREEGRFGGLVEPMLQWARDRTLREKRQVVPCRAGVLSGVVYANGDVGLCEQHDPIGNLRQANFSEIWRSPRAQDLRARIANRECWCTNEVFLWPSVTYDPPSMARALLTNRSWVPGASS